MSMACLQRRALLAADDPRPGAPDEELQDRRPAPLPRRRGPAVPGAPPQREGEGEGGGSGAPRAEPSSVEASVEISSN